MSLINVDDYNSDIKLESTKVLSNNVSCIDWCHNTPDHFACTLWDGSLKIYQIAKNQNSVGFRQHSLQIKEKASLNIGNGWPLTYCAWSQDGSAIFLGNSKGQIKVLDTESCQTIDIGMHQASINYVKPIPQYGNTLLTSAYQNTVHFWSLNMKKAVQTVTFSKKIYRAAFGGDVLATGLADQKIGVVGLKAIHKKKQVQSSQLGKYSQIQAIQVSKDGKNLGLGTIDGRVNISFIQSNASLEYNVKTHITFKAHKTEDKENIILFPVNSITFNPAFDEWFSTSGADGTMHFWNHKTKSKIKSFSYNSIPVCYSAVSRNGNFIAYALGNDWHVGPEGEKWQPKIAVHQIQQGQIKAFK